MLQSRKKIALLFVWLFSMFWVTHVYSRSWETVKNSGVIVLATEAQYSPFSYFEGSKLTGFEIELAELVAKQMGIKIEWKTVSFESLFVGLKQNRWDMVVASHGITEDRSKVVVFADPHYCSGGAIVSSSFAMRSARDLPGKTVAVQTGSTYFTQVSKIPGVKEIKTFPQDTDARAALMTKRVDVWVTDRFTGLLTIKGNPSSGLVMGDLLFSEKIAAAGSNSGVDVVTEWNKGLKAVMQNGGYATLSKKYFGEDVRCK
jgi:polar amino acid transport system substrate-binding protein